MKKIFFILLGLILLSVIGLTQEKNDEEILIDGIWIVHYKTSEILKLLNIKQKVDKDSTFCLDLQAKNNEGEIYFYNIKKSYKVQISKTGVNEYKIINNKKELRFNVNVRLSKNEGKVASLGIYDWDGKLTYNEHGRIGCLDDVQDLTSFQCKVRKVEIRKCLKVAKDRDDYFKRDEKLPF